MATVNSLNAIRMVRLGVLMALTFLILQACRRGRLLPDKDAEALTKVRQISVAVMAHYQEYKQLNLLGELPYGLAPADGIIKDLALELNPDSKLTTSNPKGIRFIEWKDGQALVDPWGQSYWIAWNLTQREPRSLEVFVWSCGPNGVNDFGQVDDIYSLNGHKMEWPRSKSNVGR